MHYKTLFIKNRIQYLEYSTQTASLEPKHTHRLINQNRLHFNSDYSFNTIKLIASKVRTSLVIQYIYNNL